MVVLIKPENKKILSALESKVHEYQGRVRNLKENMPYMDPFHSDAGYKSYIGTKLLKHGKIDTEKLSWEITDKKGEIYKDLYDNAARVLEDYIKTGGKYATGGTGF